MKIILHSEDDSDDDCRRDTFFAIVDGKRHYLAACALGTKYTWLEIQERARKIFGQDVEIVRGEDCAPLAMHWMA